MFSLFIAIAFTVESIRAIHTSFLNNYHCDVSNFSSLNSTVPVSGRGRRALRMS